MLLLPAYIVILLSHTLQAFPHPHNPTHTFTLPSFCRTSRCQTSAIRTLKSLGCTHVTRIAPLLHAHCPPTIHQSTATHAHLRYIAPFLSPRIRLYSPPFDSILRYPPSTPSFKTIRSQSARFARCSRTAGRGVVIYVIDTGCLTSHTELFPRATTILPPGSLPFRTAMDAHGHGTHVAAIAAGAHVGVASGAHVVCIRALDSKNEGSATVVARAVRTAVGLHLKSRDKLGVVSVSVGVEAKKSYTRLDRAMEYAARVGLVPVVAAGNAGGDACRFTPARAQGVITVAAGGKGGLEEYSNYGRCVDVVARGTGVWSAHVVGDGGYARSSGTSMAAPFVSGVAALLLGNEGRVGVNGVKERLKSMVDGAGFLGVDGYCRYQRGLPSSRLRPNAREMPPKNFDGPVASADKVSIRGTSRRWV